MRNLKNRLCGCECDWGNELWDICFCDCHCKNHKERYLDKKWWENYEKRRYWISYYKNKKNNYQNDLENDLLVWGGKKKNNG